MHRRWLVAAAVAAAAVTGCTSSAAERGPTSRPATAAPAAPVVLKDCWVPTSGGNVSLTGDEARALTSRAARIGRRHNDLDGVRTRLQPAVASALHVEPASAAEIAAGLAGVRPASRLVCSYARASVEPQKAGRSGLIPRARRLKAAWTEEFGQLTSGGYASDGVRSGHVDGSAHYEGRAIDVFFRPLGDREQRRRGWVFAQWLVAHAPEHHVLSVIYHDHIWTSWAAYAGWRDYVHPGATFSDRGNAILRHREHVHVAVESGRPYRP